MLIAPVYWANRLPRPETYMQLTPSHKRLVLLGLALALAAAGLLAGRSPLVAAFPIALVLALMIGLRWSGQRAGVAGWLAGLVAAVAGFGLTPDVLWVSQVKGLFISLNVLWILWPSLLLYHLVAEAGGIEAMARALQSLIRTRGLLLVVIAWAFSGMLEGLAGFGLPVAIVAPMLVNLGVAPVLAVAAVAVGHAWSVTFGDMGVIYETLRQLVAVDDASLTTLSAGLLGVACLLTGLAAARILGHAAHWRAIALLAAGMSAAQYGLAVIGLTPLAAFGAGLSGIALALPISQGSRSLAALRQVTVTPALRSAIASYGTLAALLTLITLIAPLQAALDHLRWTPALPAVTTGDGFATLPHTQTVQPLAHPGTLILLVAALSAWGFRRAGLNAPRNGQRAIQATARAATPATIGIVTMVGLSTLMEYTGMTQLLAESAADLLDAAFPLFSPLIGMLGAFATGSNNNSNVLFAGLQEHIAVLLSIAPGLLVAAQTTGGALGSMIAPAKIIVGCSTVGLRGQDGDVLRITLPYGLAIGALIGALTLALSLVG